MHAVPRLSHLPPTLYPFVVSPAPHPPCSAVMGDGATLAALLAALRPPGEQAQARSRWLCSPGLPRALTAASALLQHTEVGWAGLAAGRASPQSG
jgi:hypothetical protein